MTEEFLHYLWKYRVLSGDLRTVSGDKVDILRPGEHNHDSGPDFLDSRLRIGDTLWAGNVEIHVNGSDWYRHDHQSDKAYHTIILHVVYEHDVQVMDPAGRPVQTLILKGNFPEVIYHRYRAILDNKSWIPCEKLLPGTDLSCFEQWSHSLAVERMELKNRALKISLDQAGLNWDQAFFLNLAKSFGFSINSIPFEMLARSIPFKLLLTHHQDLLRLESLLFGQSGFLEEVPAEDYPAELKKQYLLLRSKYDLQPVPSFLWKFLRLRPSNFPTVRIAQLAALVNAPIDLFSVILSAGDINTVIAAFSVRASGFWDNHYHFNKLSGHQPKILGISSIHLLLVNFVIPFLFFYGKEKGLESLCEKSIHWLEILPSEKSSELVQWKKTGLIPTCAVHSQALIQLKRHYCDRKRCLECRIGNKMLVKEES